MERKARPARTRLDVALRGGGSAFAESKRERSKEKAEMYMYAALLTLGEKLCTWGKGTFSVKGKRERRAWNRKEHREQREGYVCTARLQGRERTCALGEEFRVSSDLRKVPQLAVEFCRRRLALLCLLRPRLLAGMVSKPGPSALSACSAKCRQQCGDTEDVRFRC